jgi:hypothetical protein
MTGDKRGSVGRRDAVGVPITVEEELRKALVKEKKRRTLKKLKASR